MAASAAASPEGHIPGEVLGIPKDDRDVGWLRLRLAQVRRAPQTVDTL